ncbi:hypothetical protein [Acetobacter ascendens]|uniref:Uncharacterized protein n=1 Tax=Acetobacter ascendens TaxID=481146 RepID=A0A1Y0V255_9PROT|nr:hypothetical protein [Acetobacter ascendens]ARW11834.1 hypothetical protein S101447_02797 [Acetobacter ascendens]
MKHTHTSASQETISLIRSFSEIERNARIRLNEIKEEMRKLRLDIEKYVKVSNPKLFQWQADLDTELKSSNLGAASLIIDDHQPFLFPEDPFKFESYPVKSFGGMFATLRIETNLSCKMVFEAKVLFGRLTSRFIWKENDHGWDEDFFPSYPHLAHNPERDGNYDTFDILSSTLHIPVTRVGDKEVTLEDPIKLINKRIEAALIESVQNNLLVRPCP